MRDYLFQRSDQKSSFHFPNRKIQVKGLAIVVNPLDTTLEALQSIQDAIGEIKVRKNITSEKQMLQDYDSIIKHLEESSQND